MEPFIESTEAAVAQGNWLAALALALCIPDQCGWLEDPKRSSEKRYVNWYDRYMLPRYSLKVGPERKVHVFLSGADCYALRCAYLHEASSSTLRQRAHDALTRFHFTNPSPGLSLHCNQSDDVLQLSVDVFCRDMSFSARAWLRDKEDDVPVQLRMNELLTVFPPGRF